MKPLRIEFSAFGSYPGVVDVDFTRLARRGLFVVTGDTGTGKTTIFDAMSFALFGDMPSKPGDDIRSHHADPSTRTFARFTFEIDSVTYVAERSPRYLRRKQRGSGTTEEVATVMLTRIDDDGTTVTLATKTRDMNDTIKGLVGLSSEQFRRVMLLPQGEVARFLLDGSADREKLLSTLFGGDVYQRVTDELDRESGRFRDEVGEIDEKLRLHHHNAVAATRDLYTELAAEVPDSFDESTIDELRSLVDAADDRVTDLGRAARRAADTARSAANALAGARKETDHLRRADELREQIRADETALPAARQAAEAARRSRAAGPLVAADDDLATRTAERDAARDELRARLDTITAAVTDAGLDGHLDVGDSSGEQILVRLTELSQRLDDDRRRHDEVLRAEADLATARQNLEDHDRTHRTLCSDVDQLDGQIAALEELIAELGDRQVDIGALDDDISRLRADRELVARRDRAAATAEQKQREETSSQNEFDALLTRYVAAEAPRLAARLVDGEPCPVCGSVEHPAPAEHAGDTVDAEELDAAQMRRDTARTAAKEAVEDLNGIRVRLGDRADDDIDSVDRQIDGLTAARTEAGRAAQELDTATTERNTIADTLQGKRADIERLEGARPGLDSAVADADSRRAAAATAATGVDADSFTRREADLRRLEDLASGLDGLRTGVTTAEARAEEAGRHLDSLVEAGDFETAADARAALVDPVEESAAIDEHDSMCGRLAERRSALEELVNLGLPDSPPDLDALAATVHQTQADADRLAESFRRADDRRTTARDAFGEHDRIGAESTDLRRWADCARRAAEVCKGRAGTRISLRRWVLGRELDRVVAVASEHLRSMTGGRYTIHRAADTGDGRQTQGLDLDVHDSHTGRPRKPSSLSGGEQFQASLALALGLADVVSHGGTAGGRRLEALFIDEGFGSLDPRALDEAIETLHQLHASGRMVAAITHVEAMKERLHPGIVVTRVRDGNGSTLTVNP